MDQSLNHQTYERLKKDIMNFTLKPGEPVSAAKIAEHYQVSRTPAREALVKLEAEGLVQIFPQSKSVISKINVSRAKQEWFLRKTLELGMIDAFFDRVTPEDIEEMKKYCLQIEQMGDSPKNAKEIYNYLVCDNQFHAITYLISGETLSANIIKNSMAHYDRFRLLTYTDNINKDRTVAEHNWLITLVQEGDREGYRAMLGRHLGHLLADITALSEQYPDYFE